MILLYKYNDEGEARLDGEYMDDSDLYMRVMRLIQCGVEFDIRYNSE